MTYNDIGKKIKSLRESQNMTLEHVGNIVGVGKSTVRKWETGQIANMRRDKIAKLAKALNTTPAYLMGWEDDIYSYENIMPLPKMKKVPLVGTIACGTPILAQENIDGYVDVPIEYNVDFCLRAKGDSMINARIFDGDVVYIHKQEDIENGEIAAVLIDDEATLKRIYKSADRITLRAENPTFDDIVYTKDDNKTITILGKALVFLSGVR